MHPLRNSKSRKGDLLDQKIPQLDIAPYFGSSRQASVPGFKFRRSEKTPSSNFFMLRTGRPVPCAAIGRRCRTVRQDIDVPEPSDTCGAGEIRPDHTIRRRIVTRRTQPAKSSPKAEGTIRRAKKANMCTPGRSDSMRMMPYCGKAGSKVEYRNPKGKPLQPNQMKRKC